MLYHPDRYQDAQDKLVANTQFHRINRAYEILGDDGKRQAYDQDGLEAVDAIKEWHVGPRLKTAQELRVDFQLAQLKEQRERTNLVTS